MTQQPSASHTEGLPAKVAGVQGVGAPLPEGSFLRSWAWQVEQLSWLGGPGKENKEEMKKSVAQVFCVMRGGLGAPRPSPGGVLSTRRGQLHELEFGRWLQFGGWGGWQQGAGLEVT